MQERASARVAVSMQVTGYTGSAVPPARTADGQSAAAYTVMTTPLGPILLASSPAGICWCRFVDGLDAALSELRRVCARHQLRADADALWLPQGCAELAAYFGARSAPLRVPLDLCTGTPLQRAVWEALRRIPRGNTRTYGEIARALSHPRAARAVGSACRSNPVAVFVPCHRVVGARGNLGGYRAGLWRKRWLLAHEQAHPDAQPAPAQA